MSSTITASTIEIFVARHYGTRTHLIIPNVHDGFNIHECDLLIVNKNNYCTEVEIKISVADFKADFKKKHKHVDIKHRIKYFYYAVPEYIVDKIRPLVPEHAGIMVLSERKGSIQRTGVPCYEFNVEKRAVADKGCRVITANELIKLQRLALMRMWDYKNEIRRLKDHYKYQNLLL